MQAPIPAKPNTNINEENAAKTAPLRVIHVMAGAEDGGAEMAYIDMCLAMHERSKKHGPDFGMQVIAACRPNATRNPILKNAGIPVYEFPFGGLFDFRTASGLKRLFRDVKPDIVQTWMSRAAQKLPSKPELAKRPVYLSRLGGYYTIGKYFKKTDVFIGNTPDLRRHIIDSGIAADHVFHLNNFAETEADTTPVNRQTLNTPDDAFVFLTLARLHRAKGLDTLLHAAKALPEHCYLWIAGAGPEEQALKTLCHTLGLDGRVRFLGWRTDRGALLSACDAVAFPSRYEPFGSTFVQAWAARRPLVTTASDGPRQYVVDGQDCLCVAIDDPAALATAMRRVMDDPALCEAITERGYDRYVAEFEKDKIVDAYLNLYRECLSQPQFALKA